MYIKERKRTTEECKLFFALIKHRCKKCKRLFKWEKGWKEVDPIGLGLINRGYLYMKCAPNKQIAEKLGKELFNSSINLSVI